MNRSNSFLFLRKGTDQYVWDHYGESVPMSTYLVAMAISKFEYELAAPAKNNVTFRIWARKSSLDQLSYAANVGPKMLQFFETYFNVTFPLPKQVRMDLDIQKIIIFYLEKKSRYICICKRIMFVILL